MSPPINPHDVRIHALTVSYKGMADRLQSECWVGPAFKPENPLPDNRLHKLVALWDTGATRSVITKKVADAVPLPNIGLVRTVGVHGPKLTPSYLISLKLPMGVHFHELKVTEGDLLGFDVLIGMDIINEGDLSVTNFKGKTVLSFRVPSMESIDFVKELNQTPKFRPMSGRNDPCPCGSGKKYKSCCMP